MTDDARLPFPTPQRPTSRWHHSSTGLRDFAITTWAVAPHKVQALLPEQFSVEVRNGAALISMVSFGDVGFRFRCMPWPTLSCGQINYRTYVRSRDGNQTGVWFFANALASRLVFIPRRLWKMPWHRCAVNITADWSAPWPTMQLASSGALGVATCAWRATGHAFRAPAGFADDAELSAIFVDPTTGWFARNTSRPSEPPQIGRYSVWHAPLHLQNAETTNARCELFERLGLITAGDQPISAGIAQHSHFEVHTPPRRWTLSAPTAPH